MAHGSGNNAAAAAVDGAPYGDGDEVDALLAHCFRTSRSASILVSQDLTVITANDEGRRLLAEDETPFRQERFAGSQAEVIRTFLDRLGEEPAVLPLSRPDGDGFWVIRGRRVTTSGLPLAFELTLTSSAQPPVRYWADLSIPFRLTPAEDKVARCLFEGQTATELAVTMGITVETARTYIRRIYIKTGASSREKLHSLLFAFQTC